MVWGKRKSERVAFEHVRPVHIMSIDGAQRLGCTLLDISTGGARLRIDDGLDIVRAEEFFLLLSTSGLAFRRCRLMWIDGSNVGVSFIQRTQKKTRSIADSR